MLALLTAFLLATAQLAQVRSSPMPEPTVTGPPLYKGEPDRVAAAGLVNAGSGATSFQITSALTAMIGSDRERAEFGKLERTYRTQVTDWSTVWKFVVRDAASKTHIPRTSTLTGAALGTRVIKNGIAPDGSFDTDVMLDHLFSHRVRVAVLKDVDARFTVAMDAEFHKITNQAMFDVAKDLGMRVQLSSFHGY